MTPREFAAFAEGYSQNREDEQERRMQEIYTSALLISRFVWCKGRPPSYEKVFGRRKAAMSDEEMLKTAEALNAMFGGSDRR